MNYADKCTVVSLVKAITENGFCFSVVDPEGCIFDDEPPTFATFAGIKAFGHMDEECVLVKCPTGEVEAVFTLIYNNGNDFDPIITISDYSTGKDAELIYDRTAKMLRTGSCMGVQALDHA